MTVTQRGSSRRWVVCRRLLRLGQAVTTNRLSTRPYGTSTASWLGGLIGSSSPYDGIGDDHGIGWSALRDDSHACSLTGACSKDAAGQWEPDEARASRPVLRARGGAIPPRDSPRRHRSFAGG